ncbi:protein of unknown function [Xenorhabdus poinarii G6]|uniref:Uncharacterized protein n=1 Tax=Xenorhabdus poinarii G6 TaxID=1354304 RepID=A0A068R4C8_9GAMM|nr:protein of unknown function [Xenorhabdus poinarii G6]
MFKCHHEACLSIRKVIMFLILFNMIHYIGFKTFYIDVGKISFFIYITDLIIASNSNKVEIR